MNDKEKHEYFSELGRKGGCAGKGLSKSRGDSEYYKRIVRKRKIHPVKKG